MLRADSCYNGSVIPRTIEELQEIARTVRKNAIEAIYRAGSGHPGSSLSCADILTALYFGGVLNYDHRDPKWERRDRFILSNGHATPAWYAVLAEAGFFDVRELFTLRDLGSELQGHPDKAMADFVETTTGSLGQGLSVGVGMALGLRQKGLATKIKTVVLSSDGEQNEGSHWEAVMLAGQEKLANLSLIIDLNGMQIGGNTEEILQLSPLEDKYKAFNWEVFSADGHDFSSLLSNFSRFVEGKKPKVVLCKTIRGKGVSFMENSKEYHAKTLTETEYQKAMEELTG